MKKIVKIALSLIFVLLFTASCTYKTCPTYAKKFDEQKDIKTLKS